MLRKVRVLGFSLLEAVVKLNPMAEQSPETVRRCDCYKSADVRSLFGWTNERGERVAVSYTTLQRWRESGRVPFVKLGQRTFAYPREKIDQMVNVGLTKS